MTKTYEVIGAAGANLRKNPSCSMPKEAAAHLPVGTQVQVIGDWTATNTAGGSKTDYLPVIYNNQVLYCSAALLGVNHRATYNSTSVTLHGHKAPLWHQSEIGGTYAEALRKHGCGPCCAAVAACLTGYDTTPPKLLAKCVALWGKPVKGESYAVSAKGLAAVLTKSGVKATYRQITKATLAGETAKIAVSLKVGKPVILFTHLYDSGDPFSGGDHYVLACGYDKNGKIVVYNSGGSKRIQLTDMATIERYLYHSCTGADTKWLKSSAGSAGVVIVD